MSTTVYLLRHGETDWGHDGDRYCGRTDVPLNALGRAQADRAAIALADIPLAAIYSSPLNRAVTTAGKLAEGRNISVIGADDLIEIDFGQWEGLTRPEIQARYPDAWCRWLEGPDQVHAGLDGETGDDCSTRGLSVVTTLAGCHDGNTIAVVGHNTLNRMLIARSLAMELRLYRSLTQSNCGINIATIDGTTIQWVTINQTSHLSKSRGGGF